MWSDHPLNQRNRTTERTVGVRVGCDREVEAGRWTKPEKGGRKYRGNLHKIGELAPLC